MPSGSGLAAALAALKAHGAATALIGALVVGGGAATVAVTTGTVHVPGVNTTQQSGDTGKESDATAGATARATACASNGDAARLADIFYPMFGGSKATAEQSICTLFVGSGGHAIGFGEIQQALEITAAIEKNHNTTTCLTASSDHGQSSSTGKPSDAGTPASGKSGNSGNSGNNGSQGNGQSTFTAPTASAATTMGIIKQVFDADGHGTPLAQLAKNCGATTATGNPSDNGSDNGSNGDNGDNGDNGHSSATPGAKPSETPEAKPTHTPGHP